MLRKRVRSAGVVSVGYDRSARVLEIEYPGGRRYRYFGVPPAIHDELMAAASKGLYVNTVIKPGFAYEAVAAGEQKKAARRSAPRKRTTEAGRQDLGAAGTLRPRRSRSGST